MKKIFIKSLIFLMVVVVVFGININTARSQGLKECSEVSSGPCTQGGKQCEKFLPTGELAGQTTSVDCKDASGKVTTIGGDNVLKDPATAAWSLFNITWGTLSGVVGMLFFIIFKIISGLYWVASILLDSVLTHTIIKFSENIKAMEGLNITWKLIRDLINLSFVFILMYEGIKKILGKQSDPIKTVTGIVTAAILINFSLFFTKAIIDASNILTIEFYNAIVSDEGSFAATLTNRLNLNSFWEPIKSGVGSSLSGDTQLAQTTTTMMLTHIMGSIATLVAIFVIMAISVLFIIRYVAYIVLLVMSPVGVAGSVVPSLKGYSDKYWQTLLNQSYWPPVYMLMTYIMLTLISHPGFITGKASEGFSTAISQPGGASMAELILNYSIVIGLLITTLTTAKSFATKGGLVTSNMVSTGTGLLGGAVFGGAALLGRNIVGRYSSGVLNDQGLKDRAAAGDASAQRKIEAAQFFAGSSFDLRNVKTGVGVLDKQLGDSSFGLGQFGKGTSNKGFKDRVDKKEKEQQEEDKKFFESLKPSEDYKEQKKKELEEFEKEEKEKSKKDKTSDEYKESEAYKKEKHLEESKAKIKAKRVDLGIDAMDTDLKVLKDNLAIETEKEKKFENEVKKEIEELKKLEEQFKKADVFDRFGIKNQIDAKQRIIDTKKKEKDDLASIIKTAKDRVNAKKDEIRIKEENSPELAEMKKKLQEDETYWISPLYEKMIAEAGGRKFDKDKKERQVDGAYEKAIKKYATDYTGDDKAEISSSFWRKVTTFNRVEKDRVRARKIAKLVKDDKEELKKQIKALQKTLKLDDDKDDDKEKKDKGGDSDAEKKDDKKEEKPTT